MQVVRSHTKMILQTLLSPPFFFFIRTRLAYFRVEERASENSCSVYMSKANMKPVIIALHMDGLRNQ